MSLETIAMELNILLLSLFIKAGTDTENLINDGQNFFGPSLNGLKGREGDYFVSFSYNAGLAAGECVACDGTR